MTLVEVGNAAQIKDLLAGLKSDTSALWGNMNAQQMVEHLISEVRYTNGVKIPVDTGLPPDFAERKQRGLNLDYDFPRNIILGTLPEDYEYTNIEEAKKQLVKEVETFHQHFAANPNMEVLHGGFGMMNYDEWVIWHGKHFTHHFKQFGLIPL
ncbi:MAG: hypothetical protein JKY70_22895 [Mucilaginibacter sp.]|nr:hypothetical protein [Mucilaginibacter sp.]